MMKQDRTNFKTIPMSNECSKTHPSRVRNGDYESFLRGDILDIGCGGDKLSVPSGQVRGWDMDDGDAQYLPSLPDKGYDSVHSSHCLEHMVDVPTALSNWSRVLRDGGSMVVTVPCFFLYEKLQWPSKFNPDHKASFSLFDVIKPVDHPHYSLSDMRRIGISCGLTLVGARVAADGYHWDKLADHEFDSTQHGGLAQITFIYQKI